MQQETVRDWPGAGLRGGWVVLADRSDACGVVHPIGDGRPVPLGYGLDQVAQVIDDN